MAECDGTLVVGWERFHAYTMIGRERSLNHNLLQNIHLATAWNQIEGSWNPASGTQGDTPAPGRHFRGGQSWEQDCRFRSGEGIAETLGRTLGDSHRMVRQFAQTEERGLTSGLSNCG